MHAYVLKPAAMLMAMVMAMTAIVCRCGMASCVSNAKAKVVQAEPQKQCERGCGKHESAPQKKHAPDKCRDCAKDKTALDRPAPALEPVVEAQPFSPIAAVFDVSVTPAAAVHRTGDGVATGPPIAILRQACLLLI